MNPELKWEVLYPHPPGQVWRALTDPAALPEWLQPEEDVLDYRVLEAVEGQSVSYSWTTRDCDAIELQAVDGGTKLRSRRAGRRRYAGPYAGFLAREGTLARLNKQ